MSTLGKILSTFTLLAISFISFADAPVWQVSKNGETVFFGGTVHVLSESDYPLPAAFDKAYQQSAVLVFEMDMSLTQTMAFQQQMLQQMTYQDGRTYADDLKPETVKKLNAYMESKGIPVANLQMFKPSMLSITLTMVELQRLGLGGTGVDAFFNTKGIADKKSFKYLELPEQQISYLANMGKGYEDELINYTLDDMKKLPTVMQQMKDAWRKGDNEELYNVAGKEWQESFPKSYNELLVERNNNWMPAVEGYFNTKEVEFVLVGAMHLVGEEGVLSQLKAKGYTIKQL
ncbi:TraB/GumN family protein [Thalassotalea nanhaiensis]|uniref:TraB/GumN family protein n=1 Tax=Thalassotalea nanhaiensis TaxID=3065648 RepID=A0ABY9TH61_9GAMM|nr:TraB/GumN family protein [Colwelliaceae bacterium SQ345]